jgi:SulP family sulfate permease
MAHEHVDVSRVTGRLRRVVVAQGLRRASTVNTLARCRLTRASLTLRSLLSSQAAPAGAAVAAAPGSRHVRVPFVNVEFDIPPIPFEDQFHQALRIADRFIPTIRGRPFFVEIASNMKSGLTVALVSLPLSISLAIAADATPVQGIITACWAGAFSAIFGGSHYNIVGPTGALSGILSYYSVTFGSDIQPILSILTGLMCLGVYFSRMDKYLVFIPSAVMHGFTMGVAFIIGANQLNFLLGLPKLTRHPEFMANLIETFKNVGQASGAAILFFAISFTALFTLSRRYGKVPWAVVLAVLGIVIGFASESSGSTRIKTIRSQYGELSLQLIMTSAYFGNAPPTNINDFNVWTSLVAGALSITAVAVLETLISARIADRMTKTVFNQPQEVLSVALANLASGMAGGIPATAALARTALNIKSGATSRASGIVNAMAITVLSTVLFSAFKFLPLPIVATILVNTAYRMLEVNEIILLSKTDPPMFIVACVTMAICIAEDPTMGIMYGTFLAMIRMLLAMLHGHAQMRVYKGTRCELSYVFDLNDRSVAKACRQYYTKGELDEEDKEHLRKKAEEAAAHSHGSQSTSLAQTAAELMRQQEEARIEREKKAGVVTAVAESIRINEALSEGGTNPGGHYLQVAPSDEDERLPKVAVYTMAGYFTYVTAQSHLERVRMLFCEPKTSLPGVDVVVFSLEEVYYADPDAFDAMGDLITELAVAGKTLFMVGFHARVRKVLEKVPWFSHVLSFRDYGSLLLHLRDILRLETERAASGAGNVSIQDFLRSRVAAMQLHQGSTSGLTAASEFVGHEDDLVLEKTKHNGHGHGSAAPATGSFGAGAAAASASAAAAPAAVATFTGSSGGGGGGGGAGFVAPAATVALASSPAAAADEEWT